MSQLIKCECGHQPSIGYCSTTPGDSRSRVKCLKCGRETKWYKTEAEAIEAWNERESKCQP